jgi:hypothetical protein
MAVTPLFGVPMDGGAQSYDGVDPSRPDQVTPPTPPGITGSHHSGFQNVLGFLGDFLLSRMQMGTPYHDARQNEKLNAARIADEQSGDTTYARTGALNPAWAAQLQNRTLDNNRANASLAATAEMRKQREDDQREKVREGARNMAASYINGLDPKSPTFPEEYKLARTRLLTSSASIRADKDLVEELSNLYPEDANPNMIHAALAGRVPIAKQWDQAITEKRDANTAQLGKDRLGVTVRGQDLTHNDRQAGIAAANSRAAGHDATSTANTQARINAGPVVSTTDSSGNVVMPDGTVRKYSGTKTTTKTRAGVTPAAPAGKWGNFVKH